MTMMEGSWQNFNNDNSREFDGGRQIFNMRVNPKANKNGTKIAQ